MAAISLRGVSKTFVGPASTKPVAAIRNLNLEVAAGELLVVLGPSGCGKTTLLRLLAGLETMSAGEIWLAGKQIDALPPAARNVAMVFQNFALVPHLTVRENWLLGMQLRGVPPAERETAVRQTAERFGLVSHLERRPEELSGGEQQRVALGRALLRRPQLYLFDEPLSQLDTPWRAELRREIKRLHQESQTTMIYVTHDQAEARALADRVVVLQQGELQQHGSFRDLYDRPSHLHVARFIGSPPLNELESNWLPTNLINNESVIVGIRPDDLQIELPARETEPGIWEAEFIRSEDWGIVSYGYVRLRAEAPHLTTTDTTPCDVLEPATFGQVIVMGKMPPGVTILPGSRIKLTVAYDKLLFFDKQTKQRIIINRG